MWRGYGFVVEKNEGGLVVIRPLADEAGRRLIYAILWLFQAVMSYVPCLASATKLRHESSGKSRMGPLGSLESRTKTFPPEVAIWTQLPPAQRDETRQARSVRDSVSDDLIPSPVLGVIKEASLEESGRGERRFPPGRAHHFDHEFDHEGASLSAEAGAARSR